jgi:hypothetical protein
MPKYTQTPGQRPKVLPKDSAAFLAFAAATEKRKAKRAAQLVEFNESGAAHAAALGLVHHPCPAQPDHSAKPVVGAGKKSREQAAKRAEKRQQALAAGSLDNKEIKASETEHPLSRIKSNRQQNLQVAQTLYERAYERNDALHKTAHKLRVCSTAGAFRMLSQEVCHKTGQALCRSRVCPTCQKALAHKRRAAFLGFFDLNREVMKDYYFYHMVLTLRHSRDEDVRDGLYTKYLMERFKMLRGTHFDKGSSSGLAAADKEYWNQRVAGGIYSIETVPGADGSPHIHLHILLLAKMPLWRRSQASAFVKRMRSRWLELTDDSTQVHLEPVYTWRLDEAGNKVKGKDGKPLKDWVTKNRLTATGGEVFESEAAAEISAYDHLRAGVAECAKYTLKTDEASLSQFSDSFLYDLIETRHRYYGRFGCLHAKSPESAKFSELKRLSADFKDLEQVDADEARQLFNPVTGEICAKSSTAMVITTFRNVKGHTAPGGDKKLANGQNAGFEHYYSINDMTKAVEYDPYGGSAVAKALSVTLYRRYKAEDDIAVDEAPAAESAEAQKSINPQSTNALSTIICPRFLLLQLNSWQYCWLVPTLRPAVSIIPSVLRLLSIPYRPGSSPLTGR